MQTAICMFGKKYWKHYVKVKFNKETCNTAYCDEKHPNKLLHNNKVCNLYITCSQIYFIFKEKSYIIHFISQFNQFESLNTSMVPKINNLTQKLDIGNCKKKINIHDIFSGNKVKCDLCEYTASKSTVLKRLVIIKH